jgi:hypothetical protein
MLALSLYLLAWASVRLINNPESLTTRTQNHPEIMDIQRI